MPRKKEITPEMRESIINMRKKGMSYQNIQGCWQIGHAEIREVIKEDAPDLLRLPRWQPTVFGTGVYRRKI